MARKRAIYFTEDELQLLVSIVRNARQEMVSDNLRSGMPAEDTDTKILLKISKELHGELSRMEFSRIGG